MPCEGDGRFESFVIMMKHSSHVCHMCVMWMCFLLACILFICSFSWAGICCKGDEDVSLFCSFVFVFLACRQLFVSTVPTSFRVNNKTSIRLCNHQTSWCWWVIHTHVNQCQSQFSQSVSQKSLTHSSFTSCKTDTDPYNLVRVIVFHMLFKSIVGIVCNRSSFKIYVK